MGDNGLLLLHGTDRRSTRFPEYSQKGIDYFEADHSKKRNNRNQAKPAQGWPCNPAALPAQKLPFLSPDSPTRSYMHAAEGVTARQVRVQS
jgi:hypothetical protein